MCEIVRMRKAHHDGLTLLEISNRIHCYTALSNNTHTHMHMHTHLHTAIAATTVKGYSQHALLCVGDVMRRPLC